MPLNPSSAIFLTNSGSTSGISRGPQSVTVHPAALFSILDHYLRRTDQQDRVIGTLLGSRTENEIEIRNCFAVLHSETSEQVAVDMEYHRTVFELHQKVNPKEVIVGWYSTGSNLNTYSALIQNFYSLETAPYQAVHLALNTGVEEGEKPGVYAYLGSPVGVFPRPENCVFVPIPCELRFNEAERSGIDLLRSALNQSSNSISPFGDLEVLEQSLRMILDMLERVLTYVRSVIAGEVKGDPVVGRYLLSALETNTQSIEQGGFSSSLQDTLMISYLANLVRAQAEVSARLQLVTSA